MERYLGIDAHAKSCTVSVMSQAGKRIRQDIVETNGEALVGYLKTLAGSKHLCLEESEWSAWLYEILERHCVEVVVEHPQWKAGTKSDAIDSWGLADRLRTGQIEIEVYKAPRRFTKLRELTRTYEMLTDDVIRVKNRMRSMYRRRATPFPGYSLEAQSKGMATLPRWMQQPVEVLGIELASIEELRGEIEETMIAESHRHPISRILETAPGIREIRVAQMLPIVITPHRFRSKRQFWAYCGFAVVTRSSSDYVRDGSGWKRMLVRQTVGLNKNCNRTLKRIFKGAAVTVIRSRMEPLWSDYQGVLERGTKPNLASVTLARKIAAIVLAMWKKKERYAPQS